MKKTKSKMKRKILRNFNTLMEDCIPPFTVLDFQVDSRRHTAIKEVLQTIPEDIYKKLIDSIDDFVWFIPHEYTYGGVHPFPTTIPKQTLKTGKTSNSTSNVLYLSPTLEKDDIKWPVVVAVVAHELAHIALGHELMAKNKEYNVQEGEVYESLCKWGFEEEAIKHQRL